MNVNIIDGYRGISHITAENIGDQNAGTFGPGLLVWDVGENLGCEQISNNLIRIKEGAFTWQGRRGSIDAGKYDDLDIENGKQGEERIDIIAIRYTKDIVTNVEKFDLVVVKGENSTTTGGATPPELAHGTIRAGAALSEVALYNVYIQNLSVSSITAQFEITSSLIKIQNQVGAMSKRIAMTGTTISGTWAGAENLVADTWYNANSDFALPRGMWLINIVLQNEFKEIKLMNTNTNDFIFDVTAPTSSFTYILNARDSIELSVRVLPGRNMTMTKSERYNILQATRIGTYEVEA